MAIKFKGVDLDGDLERVIPYVAAAEEYGGALQHLQSVWDNLTLLGELSGNNTDMSGTRVAFRELAEKAEKVGNLNITPDLLDGLLSDRPAK